MQKLLLLEFVEYTNALFWWCDTPRPAFLFTALLSERLVRHTPACGHPSPIGDGLPHHFNCQWSESVAPPRHPLSERGGRRPGCVALSKSDNPGCVAPSSIDNPGCVAPSSPHIGVSSNSFDSCSKKFKGLKRLKGLKGLKRVEGF